MSTVLLEVFGENDFSVSCFLQENDLKEHYIKMVGEGVEIKEIKQFDTTREIINSVELKIHILPHALPRSTFDLLCEVWADEDSMKRHDIFIMED